MGYGLNRISPITFAGDAFQTPDNMTQGQVPTSTPRKKGKETSSEVEHESQPMNKTYPLKQAPRQDNHPRSNSYDADTSARDIDAPCQPIGHFMPPRQAHPADNSPSGSQDDSNQNHNETTVFNGQPQQKLTSSGQDQPSNTGIQTSPVFTGITGATQTSLRHKTQVGGTQTTPPASPKKSTSSGCTQTTPPQSTHQDQGTQGQLDNNHEDWEEQQAQYGSKGKSKGKKGKKKHVQDTASYPGPSGGPNVVPRTDFQSRNLGTGKPTIQCTACEEYTHWMKDCTYDNFCTTCNNHDHTAPMCRTPRQSPAIFIHCGSADYRSGICLRKPWDNREQLCGTPDTLRNQQNCLSNTKILRGAHGNATSSEATSHGCSTQSQPQSGTKILGNSRSHHTNTRQSSHYSRYTQGNQGYYGSSSQRNTQGSSRRQQYQYPNHQGNQYQNNDNFNYRD